MARHDKDLRTDAAVPLSADDLFALLDATAEADPTARQHAIACYLSGSDGWRDAVKRLGGAFAEPESGLRERKSD